MSDTNHRWVVDSIDDEVATCEVDGIVVMRMPRWLLPEGARPGDTLAVVHRREPTSSRLEIVTEPRQRPTPPSTDGLPAPASGDVTL